MENSNGNSKITKLWKNHLFQIFMGILISSVWIDESVALSSLTPCKLQDPNNGDCLRELWQNILVKGIKDVPGVKWISIDPYKIKKAHVTVDTPIIALDMNFNKIVITGLINAKIHEVSVKNGNSFHMSLTVPKIDLKTEYSLKGRALVLSIDGKGPAHIEMRDIHMEFDVDTKRTKKDSEDFFEVQSLKTNVKHVGNMHFHFGKLFGDNEQLTNSANEVFNQNWAQLIDIMRPILSESIDASLLRQGKKYLDNLPGRIIFSDL
ncbi:circadian clock-controlled protein daywake-like [Haematobia irritans]|uniref:circadian clock-controlled protein daywake-like n=1 Tax=Haematobia irritans TaxID=7368 RepID=UPI003F4FE27D